VSLSVYPLNVGRQRLGKHVPAAVFYRVRVVSKESR
jgi:hypothetical protein